MASPATPYEVGDLDSISPNESQFTGSSSGIYFIHTVQKAFAQVELPRTPHNESEILMPALGNSTETTQIHVDSDISTSIRNAVGVPPSQDVANTLMMTYFRVWHPILPFLHGPTFLEYLESLYSSECCTDLSKVQKTHSQVIFQCVMNIAALDSDIELPTTCRITSTEGLLEVTSTMLSHHSMLSLQALLAIQLYLMATMSLTEASTVGGIVLKGIFHAGLHRCPAKYAQLSSSTCNMRKRVFWSFYVMDRYLSQSLGHPLSLQDSDIDVCRIGDIETHQNNPPLANPAEHHDGSCLGMIGFAHLTGQALELFHKNIHVRSFDHSRVLELTSDVHEWWNSLPADLQDGPEPTNEVELGVGSLFFILYQNTILLINRPFLSVDSKTPEFRSSLQVCINASRSIITTLSAQQRKMATLFWPGFLSAVWMSGLILAYACELRLYPATKAFLEIETCLKLLRKMSEKWRSAKQCDATLSVMLSNLRANTADLRKSSPRRQRHQLEQSTASRSPRTESPLAKRAKVAHANRDSRSAGPVLDMSSDVSAPLSNSSAENIYGVELPQGLGNLDGHDIFGYLSWESMFQDASLADWEL